MPERRRWNDPLGDEAAAPGHVWERWPLYYSGGIRSRDSNDLWRLPPWMRGLITWHRCLSGRRRAHVCDENSSLCMVAPGKRARLPKGRGINYSAWSLRRWRGGGGGRVRIGASSDGSTWEGLIHETSMRGEGDVSRPRGDCGVLPCGGRITAHCVGIANCSVNVDDINWATDKKKRKKKKALFAVCYDSVGFIVSKWSTRPAH